MEGKGDRDFTQLDRGRLAVLSEGGSECHTNPIQMQKYENVDNFPKTGPELDNSEKSFF